MSQSQKRNWLNARSLFIADHIDWHLVSDCSVSRWPLRERPCFPHKITILKPNAKHLYFSRATVLQCRYAECQFFFTLLFITFIKFVTRSTHAACCENLVPVVGCVASEFYSTVGKTWWSLVMGDHNNRETIASTVSMSPTALSNRRLRPNWRRHIKRCMFSIYWVSISLYRHLLCTQRRNNIANWCNWYGHVVLQVGHSPSKTLVDNDTATGPTSLRLYQFIICFITDHIDIIPVCLSDR